MLKNKHEFTVSASILIRKHNEGQYMSIYEQND